MMSDRSASNSTNAGCNRASASAVVSLLLAGILFPATSAGPPFVTDDPEPVEKGRGEFYIASQDVFGGDGGSGTLPHLEFNFGVVRQVQVHVIAPLAWDLPKETGTARYGYGDTELGVKWRFIREDSLLRGCPQVGTFPLVELPTGNAARGLGGGETRTFIPIWLQKSWGSADRRWTTYGGGGYWFHPGRGNRNYWFTGWELERQISRGLMLGGEVYHTTPAEAGESGETAFNLGGDARRVGAVAPHLLGRPRSRGAEPADRLPRDAVHLPAAVTTGLPVALHVPWRLEDEGNHVFFDRTDLGSGNPFDPLPPAFESGA